MLSIENPRQISFEIDKKKIDGMVTGTEDAWEFESDNSYYLKMTQGMHKLKKLDLHQHKFNLNELDNKITKEVKKILSE